MNDQTGPAHAGPCFWECAVLAGEVKLSNQFYETAIDKLICLRYCLIS